MKKINRTYLFIGVSSAALLTVLIIQVNWILETAKMKEYLFKEKATLVLSKTAEALAADTTTRKKIEICAGSNEIRKIDSLFKYYMNVYNIHINYFFDVKPQPFRPDRNLPYTKVQPQEGCYQTCIKDVKPGAGGTELKLIFPQQEQFIMAEMGMPFFTSVVLIIVVLVMSWRTIMSLLNEKRISEHTTDFLNNMTHEFKTPLTNIALAGKMIAKDTNIKQEDKIRHYSAIILEENEKLRLQVEHVLSMSALERGEIPLQKTELDFHQVIRDSLKCINIQIEHRQGNVATQLNADNAIISGDKTHLTNALCNLIDNAVKYSDETPLLRITTSNENGKLLVIIADNGIGIEERYHKKVFEKFFRVSTGNIHDVKGFGLGLSYVKKIIELHGGVIKLESKPGKGTIFSITLPNA